MKRNSEWKYVGVTADGKSFVYVNPSGDFRYMRTLKGKDEVYGIELKTGKYFRTPLYDDWFLHGKLLTAEEKAYRKGFRACYAEMQKIIKSGSKTNKRRKNEAKF